MPHLEHTYPQSSSQGESPESPTQGASRPIECQYFDLQMASLYACLSVRTLRRLIGQPGGLPYIQVRPTWMNGRGTGATSPHGSGRGT
jgi:hypothetical protein